jgi:hypothetical protein
VLAGESLTATLLGFVVALTPMPTMPRATTPVI